MNEMLDNNQKPTTPQIFRNFFLKFYLDEQNFFFSNESMINDSIVSKFSDKNHKYGNQFAKMIQQLSTTG